MGNIVLLDELTINQIAAGEVIERPASVVKELIENSIDAGATNITIEIKNGGISYIRITDNGKGIMPDDMEIAFERHATSKIRQAKDLETVKSMGFRGEALASIAAIARVELVSKTESSDIGRKVVVEGGKVISNEEIGCPKGTTITVQNLFFNTPVRYKFLKKDFTEFGYIEDAVTRIALINPNIAIRLINSGKTVIQTSGNNDMKTVIYNIYGKDIAENCLNVDYTYEDIKVTGVVGKPIISRSNRSNQLFFVNKRYVKDKALTSAAEQGFKGMITIGKFGFLILNISVDPHKVDVNVHPAKLEVRFAEESVAFKSMFHAIKDTLLNAGFMTDREKTEEIKKANENAFKIQNASELAAKTYSLATQEQNGNIVEDIYNSRKEENNQTDVKPINSVLENKTVMSNQDIFEKLKSLQDDLKKEVEQNPNLQLTDTYKEMEQKYNEIISPVVEQESKEEKVEVVQEENELPKALQEEKVNSESLENETIIPIVFDNSDKDNENEQVLNEDEVSYGANTNVVENNEKTNNEETNEMQNQEIPQNAEIDAKQQPSEKTSPQDSKEKILSFEEMYKELFGKEPYGGRKQPELEKKEEEEAGFYALDDNMEDKNVSIFESNADAQKIQYKFIGIAFNTYIILEIDNELYIMDQHAAHERIMYEKVKKNFFNQTGEKASQLLLLPDIINLTHKEMDIAKDNMAMFRQAGFILEEFGENTIKLSGVPDVCVDLDTEELFKETLDEINTVARTAKQEKEEKFLATVACKAAVKANMQLTKEEVDSLMRELLKLPNPFTCPHGRPTVIKMSKYEIERKFARK